MAIAIFSSFGQHCDNNGDPLSGGSITVYDAGTTNSRNIYSDTALSTAASNPITLDSAGRHDVRYTAATAYKIVLKNSSGTTIDTWDNIDPGVPIGSGYLAIANGGTGATNATTALSNLGGATAAELADLASDVATIDSQLSSNEKLHIATGTTAQRPGTPVEGDIRRNTTTAEFEGYTTSWENIKTSKHAASTTEIESETATDEYVRPDRLSSSKRVAKVVGLVTYSGGTPTLSSNVGVSGITDTGTGQLTVTFSTAFADTAYIPYAGATATGAIRLAAVNTRAVGSMLIEVRNTAGTLTDPESIEFFVFDA